MKTGTRSITRVVVKSSLALAIYVGSYFLLFDRSIPAFRESRATPSFGSSIWWAKNIRYNDSDVSTYVRGVHFLNYPYFPMDAIFGRGM